MRSNLLLWMVHHQVVQLSSVCDFENTSKVIIQCFTVFSTLNPPALLLSISRIAFSHQMKNRMAPLAPVGGPIGSSSAGGGSSGMAAPFPSSMSSGGFGSSAALLGGSSSAAGGGSFASHGSFSSIPKLPSSSSFQLPTLGEIPKKKSVIDSSVFDREDYFGTKMPTWGVVTSSRSSKAPESKATPRAPLPSVPEGPKKSLNTSALDVERPRLARVEGGGNSAVDLNLLLSNPLKPAFRSPNRDGAFDTQLTTPRTLAPVSGR